MKVKQFLRLYNVNANQIRQNWNFNRFFVFVSHRLRVADKGMTETLAQRRASNEWWMSSRIYRPWLSPRSTWGQEFSPDVLVVAQHGRFGNMIRQVCLAIASAEKLGVREVLVKSLPEFPHGTFALDNGVVLTHDSWLRSRMISRPRLVLGGDFFVKPRLPIDVDGADFDAIGASLLEAGNLVPRSRLDPGTLVIHFRSGDAFSEKPHPGLGQPPFSFYEKIISEEKPSDVVLVFEDYRNPVIKKVESHLGVMGIPYRIQSGRFRDDLQVLLSARNLVTSQGSFAEALLLLSQNVERWISFSTQPSLYFRRREIRSTVSVFDPSEEYSSQVLRGNWLNSAAQRELMIGFPSHKLDKRESHAAS